MGDPVSTGDRVFDKALNGGFPSGAAILFTGGPGTGKTTAAMQFLQSGLENDEQCVFISTEQAVSDLRLGLEGFGFDLEHPNLTLTTVHASHGESVTTGEAGLVMRTLDGGSTLDDGHSVPFTPDYIQQYLERLAPADRIVLDSASGFAAVSENRAQYRRVMLDIIRQFKDQFGATSILTAQDYAQQDDTASNAGTLSSSLALQFTVVPPYRLNPHLYIRSRPSAPGLVPEVLHSTSMPVSIRVRSRRFALAGRSSESCRCGRVARSQSPPEQVVPKRTPMQRGSTPGANPSIHGP